MGDSINKDQFQLFEKEGVQHIYTMFRDGRLYHVTLEDFKANSFEWTQNEGTEVYSVSLNLYGRVNKEN